MSFKWNDELTEIFLTLYREHQCLWNPYSPNYRNCSVKNEAFKIVIQELNVPQIRIFECLQQIEVVREKYKEEQLKAEKELKSGKLYTSKVPWFNLMSQMLCEVINAEENFSKDPVRIVPDNVTIRDRKTENPSRAAATVHGKSADLLYKPAKYGESKSKRNNSNTYVIAEKELEYGSRKQPNGQSGSNKLQRELKTVDDVNNSLWNICPFDCGWEEEKIQDKTYNGAEKLNNSKESGVQIDRNIEASLRCKQTNILNTNTYVGEVNQTTPPPMCVNEKNYDFNRKITTPAINIMQNRKNVQINTDVKQSQGNREKYDSMRAKQCSVTEDKVPHRGISLRENNVHFPSTYLSHIDDIDRDQFSKNQQPNFVINETNHCNDELTPNLILYQDTLARQSQKISDFGDEADGNETVSANKYINPCLQQFGKEITKYATRAEEDKYEVCSQFKIIIPSSDWEDKNLEITGYEVCVINPQLSKYILYQSSETPKVAIGNAECACRNEYSVPNRNQNVDSARYRSIIKLNINQKCSKEAEAIKRLEASVTTRTGEEIRRRNNHVCEIETQHKSFSNKDMQTDTSYENESIQTLRDMETSKCNSKSVKGQRFATNVSSMNGKSCRAPTPDENVNLIPQCQDALQNDSVVYGENSLPYTDDSQIENSSSSVEKFNNTRIFLNIIIKILESDDTIESSENLQRTLNTMLDSFQQMSRIEQSPAENHMDNNDENVMNNTSLSTQYNDIAPYSAPVNRRAKNTNPQKSTNNPVGLGHAATEFRPQVVELDNTTTDSRPRTVDLDVTTTDLRPQSPVVGEQNNALNREALGNQWNSGPLNETIRSINERRTRSEQPVSVLANANTSHSAANSVSNYTDEFLDEPIASSSRKIREHRTPSQLTKDFLDVIKYTMIMDGFQQVTENGNNDCCNKSNKSPHR